MIKQIAVVLALLSVIGAMGFYIKQQNDSISDLEDKAKVTEIIREKETLHYDRESERQEALQELLGKSSENKQAAQKDTSDKGSSFGVSRVNRLNQIR